MVASETLVSAVTTNTTLSMTISGFFKDSINDNPRVSVSSVCNSLPDKISATELPKEQHLKNRRATAFPVLVLT